MASQFAARRPAVRSAALLLPLALGLASAGAGAQGAGPSAAPPSPDPRVGLKAGLFDAGTAAWNMRLVSTTPPPEKFVGSTNSDLAFTGKYAIQGSYNGFQVWDISNPAKPALTTAYYCPASQSDVSVYKNLLFVSGEGNSGRLDCGDKGVRDTVSTERLRGIRIFDISVRQGAEVRRQRADTCRGSHTHTSVLGIRATRRTSTSTSPARPTCARRARAAGCVSSARRTPTRRSSASRSSRSARRNPAAAIVSSPRIFTPVAPPRHGRRRRSAARSARAERPRRLHGDVIGDEVAAEPDDTAACSTACKARGGAARPPAPTARALRAGLPGIIAKMIGEDEGTSRGPRPGPTQCHDITVYPGIGLAGGACEGYGLLLDIRDPANPTRLAAVADSNFSYWHSATFNNDGSKVLFTDEWGGGGAPKCRASDPKQWGANAIFTVANGQMQFQSYYKLPAPQTVQENCVAHNGSLVPIPGRDVMVQAWYQGGISVFDWTDPKNAREIAYFDRGPVDSTRMQMGGSWSVYWYNGQIVSSEIARGLDVFELQPSAHLTQNEIDAAKTVRLDYLNAQGQPKYAWPASFALARAYADQLERSQGLAGARLATVRQALTGAERARGAQRGTALTRLATQIDADAAASSDAAKVRMLSAAVRQLASTR
jgi:hypothetical protein